jgi:hypothetical protein
VPADPAKRLNDSDAPESGNGISGISGISGGRFRLVARPCRHSVARQHGAPARSA